MNPSWIKSAFLFVFSALGVSVAGASTLTVGPTGMYATPCPAIRAAAPGDTIQIDYNSGIPYQEPGDPTHNNRSDCVWYTNSLTIVGVNGRAILDAAGETIEKGILNPRGAYEVISNLELRNSTNGNNAAAIRVDAGVTNAPAGGSITVEYCYIHDNEDGILTNGVGPGSAGEGQPDPNADGAFLSATPFFLFQYDEFSHNGVNASGFTHNMYIGEDTTGVLSFTLQYSWSHDAVLGHTVKSRAPNNYILYNLITDQLGATSYLLDFPLGGSTYIVGNSLYKSATTNSGANRGFMLWRDVGDNGVGDPEYSSPHEDLHFENNTVVLDPSNNTPAYVVASCQSTDVSMCSMPMYGPVLSVNAVVQNNIFVGPATLAVNQSTAVSFNNLIESNTPANLASLFTDWAHFNFHLAAGSPAIGAGLYPPTDNTGAADNTALAAFEYVHPLGEVARPKPSGMHMDEGAYSFPRVDTPPNPGLSYTTSVTTPGTGIITLTGLPVPLAGHYNSAEFIPTVGGIAPISPVSSTTGTIMATFSTSPVTATTMVPIDIYVNGAHLTATVTVIPGPVALQSITLDAQYYPRTTVHLSNASMSPVTINLSSSDQSILSVPASVVVPAGQTSVETGSETGSLYGQSPATKTATITATYGGATQSLPVVVYAPYVNHFYCNIYPNCTVVGGQKINNFVVGIAGDFPTAGGPVTFNSDTPSVIPNQTFPGPGGNFYSYFVLTSNTVTTTMSVTLSISVNGSTKLPNQVITVTPPGVASSIAVSSGSGQTSQVGIKFPNPLVALVNDASGHPVASASVTFASSTVSFPGGSTVLTDSNGQATVVGQPTTTGALSVTASVTGVSTPATFSETGTANTTPASVTVVSGSGQTSQDGTNFANPLVVVVKNTLGAALSGVSVTYAGTGVSFPHGATAVTGSNGQASIVAQPTAVGALTVMASVVGVSPPASFSETGTANPPASVAVVSGSGQTAAVNLNFPAALVVVVKNATGGIVSGASVTFAGTGIGFSGSTTVTTNANGRAAITAHPTTTGTLSATATAAGVSAPATFSETGTPNTPSSIAVASGSGQYAAVGSYFSNYLVAQVKNAAGGVVPGASVTFGGVDLGFSGSTTVVTNSNGNAQIKAKPTSGGALTATATVTGVSTPASFPENGVTGGLLSSISFDNAGQAPTSVTLTAAAPTGGAVVTLTSSDSSIEYIPATVTIPAGQTTAETGSLLGSLWGQTPFSKTATLTASYAGTTKSVTAAVDYTSIHSFFGPSSVVGGQVAGFVLETAFNGTPYGGATVSITSDVPSAVPNQTFPVGAGVSFIPLNLTTTVVSASVSVNVTLTYNGATTTVPLTVTP